MQGYILVRLYLRVPYFKMKQAIFVHLSVSLSFKTVLWMLSRYCYAWLQIFSFRYKIKKAFKFPRSKNTYALRKCRIFSYKNTVSKLLLLGSYFGLT